MSRMKRTLLGFGVLWLVGCGGPSEEVDHAKSPDEIIAEQERLGAEQERKSKEHAQYSGNLNAEETDMEKKQQFDKKQTKLELQRATRSAETCVGVMTDKDTPRGTGKVTLVFDNEGHVKSGTIAAPFEGTPIGKCVMNAYNAVIVPPYVGPEATIDWEVDLTGSKKDGGKEAKKDD
jgi:hypothetical protein